MCSGVVRQFWKWVKEETEYDTLHSVFARYMKDKTRVYEMRQVD